jgi:thiamine-phosphate pyrophosphorylase
MLPRLHVITDDDVIADAAFADRAQAVLAAGSLDVALHLRGHRTPAIDRYHLAARLAAAALRSGAWLIINDRIDIAMAVRANGVQLGVASLPVSDARALLGAGARIGFSAHDASRAVEAVTDGADFIVLGTIFETESHPGRAGSGTAALRNCAERTGVPVIGIGGMRAERVAAVAAAGGWGVAALRGVWAAPDAAAATVEYIAAIRAAWPRAEERKPVT